MHNLLLTALSAAMLLGATAAFAQGIPQPPPVYGSVWTADQLRAARLQSSVPDSNPTTNAHTVKPRVSQRATSSSATGS